MESTGGKGLMGVEKMVRDNTSNLVNIGLLLVLALSLIGEKWGFSNLSAFGSVAIAVSISVFCLKYGFKIENIDFTEADSQTSCSEASDVSEFKSSPIEPVSNVSPQEYDLQSILDLMQEGEGRARLKPTLDSVDKWTKYFERSEHRNHIYSTNIGSDSSRMRELGRISLNITNHNVFVTVNSDRSPKDGRSDDLQEKGTIFIP